ncbi:MAG: hypothetical protein P8M02_01870 [Flavobacteriaceae bacterium]|nr:hypothetical protein [Flavobacteriaceae bacterium]MDG2386147.1 hypothetical protein [Flavobacteriaceae bacterium]
MKKFKFLLLLIPLALFISFLDSEILKGFLASGETLDHYSYIGVLVTAVVIIIYFVLQFDKKSNT